MKANTFLKIMNNDSFFNEQILDMHHSEHLRTFSPALKKIIEQMTFKHL